MSIELIVSAEGEVTWRKEVLAHLGIGPGGKLVVDLLPDASARMQARPTRSMDALFGCLKRPGQPTLSIADMNEIIAAGWAGER